MNPDNMAIQVFQQTHSNFELFRYDLRGYDLELLQLDRGPFTSKLQQLHCGNVFVNHFTTTRRLDVAGIPPPGFITFGVPTQQCMPFTWRGKKSDGDTLQVYGSSTEIEMVTNPFFEAIDVSLSEETFNALMHRWEFPEFAEMASKGDMWVCNPNQLKTLRIRLRFVCAVLDGNPDAQQQYPSLNSIINYEIPYLLAQILMSGGLPLKNPVSAKRAKALTKGLDYIKTTPRKSTSLHRFCSEAGISERTLRRAFLDHFGVNAKSYAQSFHLNNARKILIKSDHRTSSVAEVAVRSGFVHMSQFAKDYHCHFGEQPSATLNRRKV